MGITIDGIYWDYGPDDPIDVFDISKSYYLTKYRPINKTQGLDFNPDWFRQAAISKMSTGKYSGAVMGSKGYRDYWTEQQQRCIHGYESNGYRISGDNYFFLNFYNLKDTATDSLNPEYGFPMFLVFQYEYFHYLEMTRILMKDVAVLKSRGIGFSEIISASAVNPYTHLPNYRSVITASSSDHLTPTLEKVWYQMDWLNEHTENAFKRVRLAINTKLHKRASIKHRDLSESGHRAEVKGIIVDEPDKLRGDRIQLLVLEEAGANNVLLKTWNKGIALVTVLGGKRVGRMVAFGTGGSSKASSMEGLKTLINNPRGYNILPVRHNFTVDGRYIETGMFIPAYRIVFELLDNRGWCDPDESRKWYEKERELKASDPKDLIDFKAEYCFTIEEALIQVEDNVFPREELAEQLAAIQVYKTVEKPKRGFLTWEIDPVKAEKTGKVKWRDDPDGNILLKEHPESLDDNGYYDNLYVGGIDSIDIGGKDSATTDTTKLSDFCIVIKKRVLGLQDPAYVAMYKDRPRDIREAYENAAKLLTYFNAKAVLEASRTTLLTYFRDNKYFHLLMRRPRATLTDVRRTNANMIGAPVTEKTINHYLELITEMCLDYSHTIVFEEMIEQLLNYSFEKKKMFDIVAALGMAELGDEEMGLRKPVERDVVVKPFEDFGYWTDSQGYKHFGVIPENKDAHGRVRERDSWLYS